MPTHSVVDVGNDEQDSLDVFCQQIALIYGLIDGNNGDTATVQLTLIGQTLGHITTETVVIIYYDSVNFGVVEDDANHLQEFISRFLCALECAAEIVLNLLVVIFAISVARIQLRVN
ncbi:MAG: hypothetical protein II315_05660 [Rikenellaceae bacterium]|nr:hypothetical protein [Rikenellaceae bacterium]